MSSLEGSKAKQSSLFTQGEWTKHETCLQPDPAYFIEHFMVRVQCLSQGHLNGGNFNVQVQDSN